jgi:hypothetical protein
MYLYLRVYASTLHVVQIWLVRQNHEARAGNSIPCRHVNKAIMRYMFHDVQRVGGDATSAEASPLRSSSGSCLNTATLQQQQQPIISMEEDEMSDQEVVSTDQLSTL